MKLNVEEFDKFAAERKVYPSILLNRLGGGILAYAEIKNNGVRIGDELVKDIYNKLGEKLTLRLIDFEGGTIDGFKSRYIELNGKLF